MTNEELLERLEAGDESVRELIVTQNRPLVISFAKRYEIRNDSVFDLEELIACGEVGLVKAVNGYKTGNGIKFSTYASKCILNEIFMALRQYRKHSQNYSLDALASDNVRFIDFLKDDCEDYVNDVHNHMMLKSAIQALDQLNEKERQVMIIVMQNGGFPKQTDIAKSIKCSQSYVSRIISKAQRKLRIICEEQGGTNQ